MKQNLLAVTLLALLGGAGFAPAALAQGSDASAQYPSPQNSSAQNSSGQYQGAATDALSLLSRQIESLPTLNAARAEVRAAELELKAAANAVYNPEIGVGFQHAQTDSYSLSVSQTLDWGNKQQVAQTEALLMLRRAEAKLELDRSLLWAEALGAMVAKKQSEAVLGFQAEQRKLAKAQLQLATERQRGGLISGGELSLIELDVASFEAAVSLAKQAVIEADTRLLALFGTLDLPTLDMATLLADGVMDISHSNISQLPALQLAYQEVQLARLGADKLRAETSADPTFSLDAEKEGDDNKVGVSVSMPLKIRNSYNEAIAAATEAGVGAEQQYLASERALTQAWRQYQYAQPKLRDSWQEWQRRVQGSSSALGASLASQWQTGEISTSDLLQGKRQLAQGFIAGTELEARLYQHWIDWMGQSGQLSSLATTALSQGVNHP